jgi:hypothetical protein
MKEEKDRLKKVVEFAKEMCPSFSRLFENILEDAAELEPMTERSPYKRVMRAIDEGFQLETEIVNRANVTSDVLQKMVGAGVLEVVPQGGKTEGARGARKMLFQRKKFESRATVKSVRVVAPALAY